MGPHAGNVPFSCSPIGKPHPKNCWKYYDEKHSSLLCLSVDHGQTVLLNVSMFA